MSISVSPDLTRQIAYLARLSLSEEEVTLYTSQLKDVLQYFELLQEVDVAHVSPLVHPFAAPTPLRKDEVIPFQSDGILRCASHVVYDGFQVPPIL